MAKEIYAILQINDHEIRMLVGQWLNGRLHILKLERISHQGIVDNKITRPAEIIEAINRALVNIEKNVKLRITRVVLVVGSHDLRHFNKLVHSDVYDPLNRILLPNIQEIYRQCYNESVEVQSQLVNCKVYRYRVNSAYTFQVPLGEKTSRVYADVDFYTVNKNTLYQLVQLVEQAQLEILDVVVDSLANGHEIALFDFNSDKYSVVIQMDEQSTTLSMYFQGKLVNSELVDLGYRPWAQKLSQALKIPYDMALKLILNNAQVNTNSYGRDPIALWSQDKKSFTCSQHDIMQVIKDYVNHYIQQLKRLCSEIIKTDNALFYLVGQGALIKGMDQRLATEFNSLTATYIPTTIGARDSSLVSLLGAFYHYIDQKQWQTNQDEQMTQEIKSA